VFDDAVLMVPPLLPFDSTNEDKTPITSKHPAMTKEDRNCLWWR
jgi:hypothetical protein